MAIVHVPPHAGLMFDEVEGRGSGSLGDEALGKAGGVWEPLVSLKELLLFLCGDPIYNLFDIFCNFQIQFVGFRAILGVL